MRASSPPASRDLTYGFQALTQFRRVRDLRSQGQTMRQIEAELQGQLSLFRAEEAQITRLLTPFEEALVLHEQADPKADEYYLEAINEGDNVAEAYCNLALINLERGDASKALDQLTHSLKHDPRHVEAHYNLANLYYDHGDFQLARLHYEAAIQIEPASRWSTSTSPSSTIDSTMSAPQLRPWLVIESSPLTTTTSTHWTSC